MYLRTTLANGLRIVGERIPHLNSVAIGLWVGVGSRDEATGQEGLSHLIEHMFFKGTANRSARDLAEEIDAVGGQLNAFTTREYTCFYARVLDKHISLAMELLSEMFCASTLDPGELAKEKGVILEEIKSYEDAPDESVHDLLAAAIWPGHPLGRPILGTPASVAALTRNDLLAYLAKHYRASNTILAAAGRIDPDELAALAGRYLSGLPPGKPVNRTVRPEPAGTRLLKRKDTEQVHICLGGPGVEKTSPDKFAVLILDSILGGSISSRLFQKLREDRGLVYAIGSSHSAFCDTGLFSIYAGTAPDKVREVIGLILEELARLSAQPVAAEELARAKEQLRGNFLLGLESASARMSRLAKAEMFYGEILEPEEILARVDAVTPDDVARVAGDIFGRRLPMAVIAPPHLRMDLEMIGREGEAH